LAELLSQYFAFTTRTPEWVNQVLSFDELRELAQDDRHVADDLRRMEDVLESSPEEAWGPAGWEPSCVTWSAATTSGAWKA